MSAQCCENPATYHRIRAQRVRGRSAFRLFYVWQCGFCGAVGAEVPLEPPPKNDAGRKRGQSASGTESTNPKSKDAPVEAPEAMHSAQTWSWLLSTPQARRWSWRVIDGGKR